MLNLLIIDKDFNHSKMLLNYISENSDNIRVHSIVNNLFEGIKILNNGKIDMILINLECNVDTIINHLSTISTLFNERYKNSILMLTNNNLIKQPNHSYIYSYISSYEDISLIFSKINEIAKIKSHEISTTTLLEKINRELDYIGYNLSHHGSRYIAESILIIYNNYDSSENLKQHVYPIIAKKYHKTVNTVKGDITKATTCMYYDCDETRLKNYFNFYSVTKPKPKLVIYTILNKISNIA